MENRVIKFRAWDKKRKKMFLPSLLSAYSYNNDLPLKTIRFQGDGYWDSILMQFTGLKDKNRVEIYEGDIVRLTNGLNQVQQKSIISEIGFLDGAFCAYWRRTELWE